MQPVNEAKEDPRRGVVLERGPGVAVAIVLRVAGPQAGGVQSPVEPHAGPAGKIEQLIQKRKVSIQRRRLNAPQLLSLPLGDRAQFGDRPPVVGELLP